MKITPLISSAALMAIAGCISIDPTSTMDDLNEARRAAAGRAAIRSSENGAPLSGSDRPAVADNGRLPRISGAITIYDAVATALENNLALRSARLRRDEATAQIVEARAAAYPNLGLNAGVDSDLKDRDGENDPDSFSAGAKITQPLWRFGMISAGIRYARLYAASTDAEIAAQTQSTIEQVSREYCDVLLAQQLVGVYEESVGVAERMLATAKSKRSAGTVADYEVLRAEVEVARSNSDLIKERNALHTSLVTLLHTMGVDQDSDITLSDELYYTPFEPDLGELISIALANRPDLIQAEAAVRMAEENLSIAKSSYGPSADIYASASMRNPGTDDEDWSDSWKAGASLTYTLFDGLERRGKVDRAKAKLRQAEAALCDAEENVRVDVTQAVLALRNADELYQSQKKNIDLAQEALRMLESGHRNGRNTQIEVLDARSALTEAMGDYHKALHDLTTAKLALRLATGTMVPNVAVGTK